MKIVVTLLPIGEAATDSSSIALDVVKEYIDSPRCKEHLSDKTSMGGITHKDRKNRGSVQDVGEDDLILINQNSVGYISKFFIKDNYLWAEFELFDPEDFEPGDLRNKIAYIRGLLKRGVKLPISAVIDAYWDAYENAKEIIKIAGLDFTMNPAFRGAKIQQIIYDNE